MEVSDQLHDPADLPTAKTPGTNFIGRVCPGAGLDAVAKRKSLPLPGIELRSFSS